MNTYPCIICGKPLKAAFDGAPTQPSGGVMCVTYGNYGSTVYDPGDSRREALVFNVCDACIVEAGWEGRLQRRVRIPNPDDFEYSAWHGGEGT